MRRWLRGADFGLIAAMFAVILVSIPIQSSALRSTEPPIELSAHLFRVGVAVFAFFAASVVDHRFLVRFAPHVFFVVLAVSAYAATAAALRAGTRRWLDVGGFTVQPGELAKLALVMFLAWLMARAMDKGLGLLAMGGSAIAIAALIGATWVQPDLGSAVVLVGIFGGMLILGGVRWHLLGRAAFLGLVATPLLWFWGLHDYQRERVLGFLGVLDDPRGADYQSLQAAVAVGSGGFFGAGLGQGTQTTFQFLPASHTDFVFAVLAEEFGFVGVVALLGLYLYLGVKLLDVAGRVARSRDYVGAFMVGGFFLMIFLQGLYNVAMVAGLVPVKGFPLPLVSYGGNSSLVTAAAIGLAISVRRRVESA